MNTTDNSDWESSFSQILNRTKHNLNRINQRYAPSSGPPTAVDLNVLAPRGVINNENVNQNSMLLDRFSKSDPFLQRTDPVRNNSSNNTGGGTDPNLLERLIRIEEQHRATESATNSRLSNIENNIEVALTRSERSSNQMKELEHSIMQINSKLSTMSGFIELLQNDNESKRSVMSKMDHWIRQGEIWREDVDNKMETLTKLAKSLDRTRTEQRELMAEHATRYELEQLRDKMTVVTQQSVAASLSAWHDKIEQSVRNVERQIALLRIGMTDAGSGSLGAEVLLSQEQVTAVLANPLPSELLLKGTVAQEVMQMENKLEEKLENRLQLYLKDRVEGSHNTLNEQLRRQLHDLCAEMGLDYPEIELGAHFSDTFGGGGDRSSSGVDMAGAKARESYRIRLLEARKKSEREIEEIAHKVSLISSELAEVQQSAAVDTRHHTAAISNLERRVEETITMSSNSVHTIAERSSKLEELVRETELTIRSSVTDTKSELIERITDLSKEWSTERAGLDRRLLVNERISEDCLDRIKLSQSAVESYFKASPEVKRFQRSAELVAQLQLQLNTVQEEVRSTSNTVHKLNANTSTKNEHLELRERVARLEPTVLEKLPDYFESTKRVVDLSSITQSRLDKLDALTTHQHNDIASTISKLSAVDVLTTQLKGLTTVATEEVRRLTASVAEMDSMTRKDISYLRDLTGSISSRVVAVEGKVSIMNKTYAADTVTTNNSLAKLTTICEELQAHDATAQNTLVQLQWALEAEHRESVDQFAVVRGRLDLLNQLHQSRADAGDHSEGKSIQIKFTTARDPTQEEREAEEVSYQLHSPVKNIPSEHSQSIQQSTTASFQEQSFIRSHSEAAQRSQSIPPIPPVVTQSASKRGGGYSAFMTEASPMSSPEKSMSRSNTSAVPPLSAPVEEGVTVDTSVASDLKSEGLPNDTVGPSDAEQSHVHSTPGSDREVARNYEASPQDDAEEASEGDYDLSDSAHSSPVQHRSVPHTQEDDNGDQSVSAEANMRPGDNSWDDTRSGSSGTGEDADRTNMSASRIPVHSAFDMSMPSYVSNIASSGEDRLSDGSPDRDSRFGRSGSDADSHGSAGKLSLGDEDSIENLNTTVAGLQKHRETVLEGNTPGRTPTVTVRQAEVEEDSSSEEDEDEQSNSGSEHSAEDHSGSEHSADDDDHSHDGSEFDGDLERDQGEGEGDNESASKSAEDSTSAGGSYSQIDAVDRSAGASGGANLHRSAVENSWDQSNLQSSFASGSQGTPSKDHGNTSSISGSSESTSSAAKKPLGLGIPSLSLSGLAPRHDDAEEMPSYRSTGRHQVPPTGSARQDVSDWDAESSLASAAAADSPHRPILPQHPEETSLKPSDPIIATEGSAPADTSVLGQSHIIGSSDAVSSPSKQKSGLTESTGGSVSDSSASSSDFTSSSSSYLTISSASPTKPTVASVATAVLKAPVPVRAPTGNLNTSTLSKTDSIKERLKNRLNKNKATESANTSKAPSPGPTDEVMSFEDLDDSRT